MNSGILIQSKLQKTSESLQALFDGETETAAQRLQRQQIINDLNYGFEKDVLSIYEGIHMQMEVKDPEVEQLGDLYDIDSFLGEKEKKKEEEETQRKEKKQVSGQWNYDIQSKYISILKQRANERKRELDIIYEK